MAHQKEIAPIIISKAVCTEIAQLQHTAVSSITKTFCTHFLSLPSLAFSPILKEDLVWNRMRFKGTTPSHRQHRLCNYIYFPFILLNEPQNSIRTIKLHYRFSCKETFISFRLAVLFCSKQHRAQCTGCECTVQGHGFCLELNLQYWAMAHSLHMKPHMKWCKSSEANIEFNIWAKSVYLFIFYLSKHQAR